jgi:TrmH family RNA methyltransferase
MAMEYAEITSLSNPHIKEAMAVKERLIRKKPHTFLIEGVHLIEMAVASGVEIEEIFLTAVFSKKERQKFLGIIGKSSSRVFEVTDQIMNSLADTKTPQGVVAVVTYHPLTLDRLSFRQQPLLVVIDGIQDPGNLGTIIRTSDAAGSDAVILLPGTCSAFAQKTVRATAGSIFNIPVAHVDMDALIPWLKFHKITLTATSADAEKSVFDADLRESVALVFGNEARGISKTIKRTADLSLRIPLYGKAESLNVATSAAICLYEAARQRR